MQPYEFAALGVEAMSCLSICVGSRPLHGTLEGTTQALKVFMRVSINTGPEYRPQAIETLAIGTPKNAALILEPRQQFLDAAVETSRPA